MTSNIVVAKIPITGKGQVNVFQVNIPKDAASIVGIQTGILGISGIKQLTGKALAGTVKLQALHAADLCYCEDLYIGSGSLDKALPGFAQFPALVDFFAFPLMPNSHDSIARVQIKSCFTLSGTYQDALGKALNTDVAYTVGIYIWTQVGNNKTEKNDTAISK